MPHEDVFLLPYGALPFYFAAGVESCIVQYHHRYALRSRIFGQGFNEGNHLIASDVALYQIEMKALVVPRQCSDQVETP